MVTEKVATTAPARPRSLAVHGGLLGLVMLIGLVLFGQGAVFHPDEGAMLLQEEIVEDTGRFATPNPQPELDPEMEALPIEIASRTGDGTWLPFGKHPAYVWAMVAASELFADEGPLILSSAGVVLAAVAAALIAERARTGTGPLALWATGLAAPLFFDGYIVIGHAVGAAFAACLALVMWQASAGRGSDARLLGLLAVVLAGLLVLVRSEGLFLVVALAVGLAVASPARRTPFVLGVAVVASVLLAYRWIDPHLFTRVAETGSSEATGEAGATDIGRTITGRAAAFWSAMFDPSETADLLGNVAPFIGMSAFWYAAVRLRHPDGESIAIRIAVVGTLAYLAAATTGDLLRGLVVATPVLAGVVGLRRTDLDSPVIRMTLVAALCFAAAVALTQYDTAGGAHVGGRYFVIGLPLVVPAAIIGWTRLIEQRGPVAGRWLPRLLVIATIAAAVQSGTAMRDQRAFVGQLVDHIEATRSDVGTGTPAAVLSTNGWGSRFAWELVDEGVWLAPGNESLARYSDRLAALGEPVVLFTGDPAYDELALGTQWRIDWRSTFIAVLTPR